jgi:hypothetical protein
LKFLFFFLFGERELIRWRDGHLTGISWLSLDRKRAMLRYSRILWNALYATRYTSRATLTWCTYETWRLRRGDNVVCKGQKCSIVFTGQKGPEF